MARTAAARRDLLRQASPAAAPEYVSASEATRLLRIKPQTLYTYVSRGLIRSLAQPNDKRRLYSTKTFTKTFGMHSPVAR